MDKIVDGVIKGAKIPVKVVEGVIVDTTDILKTSGELATGKGLASGVLSLTLAFLCFLGVLAFHYPQYLTTPELRHQYNVDVIRQIMLTSLLIAGTWSICNIVANRTRNINIAALLLVIATVSLGGSRVAVTDFSTGTPYLGLDWFILDLLGSSVIFIVIEKLFPLYKGQTIFRKFWQTDMIYFGFNHLLIGFMLLVVNYLVHNVFGWMIKTELQQLIQSIWFVPQLLLCVFVADFVEYWTHRSYHEVPFLWKYHSVHHSSEVMDWIAGSRLHH
jgi:hypothetical protein